MASVSTACPAIGTMEDLNEGDTAWMLTSAALVLLMTPGLAFFYGGMVRQKNVVNTLMMSYTAMGIVMVQWVLFGYSFAFAPGDEGFGSFRWGGFKEVGSLPNADYAATIPHLAYANFQMMFAVITPALISGSIAERMQFKSFVLFILIWTTVVYDPLAHWVWSGYSKYDSLGNCTFVVGWLRSLGAIDFAGGTVIHVSSGFSGLVASYIVGARSSHKAKKHQPPHNIPFVLLGAGMLWFGWLGFNGGSSLASNSAAALAVTNTSIAAAAAFLTWLMLDTLLHQKPSAVGAVSGAVVGMVAITPASGYVLPGWAIMIGFLATIICYFVIKFKHFFRVDDALDCFFVHGVGGVCGALLTGLFATLEANPAGANGAFYGNPKLFGVQLLAVLVAVALSSAATAVILIFFKYTIGLRTNDKLEEEEGMDATIHKEKGLHVEEEQPKPIRGEGLGELRRVLTQSFSRTNINKMRNNTVEADIELQASPKPAVIEVKKPKEEPKKVPAKKAESSSDSSDSSPSSSEDEAQKKKGKEGKKEEKK